MTPEALRAHVEFLASDLLEGRKPGTRGFDLAARYVASQFQSVGLEPPGGSWFQTVPLVERTPNAVAGARMRIGDRHLTLGEGALWALSGEGAQRWDGESVFVGYGVAAGSGAEDFGGLDVRGKAVVVLDGAPASLPPAKAKWLGRDRIHKLAERGAAGVITLLDDKALTETPWSVYREDFAQPFMNWTSADGMPFRHVAMRFSAVLDKHAAALLFSTSPESLEELQAKAASGAPLPSFKLARSVSVEGTNHWRRFSSDNVLGVVRGSDASVADEYVLVTAHLDHVGMDPATPGADKIFNGALDNASGTAAMIEVAREIASATRRPRRPIMFVATTAEEIGLLGSDYLAANPLPQGGRVVAVVNIDGGVPPHALRKVVGNGAKHSTIAEHLESVPATSTIPVVLDDLPPDEFFERTDHFSFARRGIPAVYLVMGGATEQEKAVFRPHIHHPGDDLGLPFDWAGGAHFVDIAHRLVRKLADAPQAPRWYADSPIAELYAKDRPKAVRPRSAAVSKVPIGR